MPVLGLDDSMGGSKEEEVNGLENPQNDTINTQSGSQSVWGEGGKHF